MKLAGIGAFHRAPELVGPGPRRRQSHRYGRSRLDMHLDWDSLIAIEVFEDRAAMDRQEAQAEVAKVIQLIEAGTLRSAPWTI